DSLVACVAPDDRRALAQRLRGGGVCGASAAGGVRRVGVGTEGCIERVVLRAHALGLPSLCARAEVAAPVWTRDGPVRPWAEGQTDAGNGAIRVVVAGLLAAAQVHVVDGEKVFDSPAIARGENPPV